MSSDDNGTEHPPPATATPGAGDPPGGAEAKPDSPVGGSEGDAVQKRTEETESGAHTTTAPPKIAGDPEKNSKSVVEVNTTFQSAAINNLLINATTVAPSRKRTVGRLDRLDIDRLLRNFVTPKSYQEALDALSTDHVVVLEGRVGDGRHAAAVSLLQELTDERLNMLTPIMSLADLADRDYESSQGFIVIDRIVERGTTDTDFVWRTVRDRVRNCAAYLVITSASSSTGAIEAVKHIRWERPELEHVLRAHLHELGDERLAELMEHIPESWRMADIAQMCERLNAGGSMDDALETFGAAARKRVTDWFAEERSLREILAVTALSFATGANHRDFGEHLAQLEEQVDSGEPADDGEPTVGKALPKPLPARRKELLGDSSLIVEKRIQEDLKTRTVLVFRSPSYRRWVLERLWHDYDNALWDSVRAWIDSNLLILDRYELAYGLAQLAEIDYDEVNDSYLVPWSDGVRAWPGQVAATWVLWLMCRDDTLSRLALTTATRWATNGSPAQRWTAAVAFSGELGRLYPADAVRRLWNLIVQSRDTDPNARFALAGLFSYLVSTDSDASLVLRVLSRHVSKFAKTDFRLYGLTMNAILAVLSVWDYEANQPSVFRLLRSQPERLELVISLWAGPLRNNHYRKDAIEALVAGIKSLERVSENPRREVAEIGEALSDVLSAEEQAVLLQGIRALYNRTRERASVLEALLQALATTLRNLKAKGTR